MNRPRKSALLFDIETESAPEADLESVMPEFTAPANWKDPEKIAENIRSQKSKWIEKAALDALTGRVFAVGYQRIDDGEYGDVSMDTVVDQGMHEVRVIAKAFHLIADARQGAEYKVYGFNLADFDIPFLVRRAILLGLPIPSGLRPSGSSRFYLPNYVIDMRAIWGAGDYQPSGSLDAIGKAMGCEGKPTEAAFFAPMYRDPKQRALAVQYRTREFLQMATLYWSIFKHD